MHPKQPSPPTRAQAAPVRERGPSLGWEALETAFGALYMRRQARKQSAATREDPANTSAEALLERHEVALAAVASTFAGRRVLVRAAEAAGGLAAGVLLMPKRIALVANPQANRDFLFVRAALDGARLALGSVPLHNTAASDQEADMLLQGLRVAFELAGRFDGFRERLACAAQWELGARPPCETLPPHEQALERLRWAALECLGAWTSPPSLNLFELALQAFQQTPLVSRAAPRRSFLRRLMASHPAPLVSPGPLLLLGGPLESTDQALALTAQTDAESSAAASAPTERAAKERDYVHPTQVEDDSAKESMPMHSFEKVDFADSYEGGFRRMDGTDDMDEQGDSLDGVDLRELIRGGPPVHSVYQADIGPVSRIPDVQHVLPGERALHYDEWDPSIRVYRRQWVTLYPTSIQTQDVAFGLALRKQLGTVIRQALAALDQQRTERVERNRQLDGNDVDLDGLIEEYGERCRGGTPSGRVYLHAPRLERDTATCVILDLSDSADSWVDNQRVLDVELAAACVLGEVADRLDDDLAILAFASNTRNLCRTWTVKDWDEPWATGRSRLGVLKPQGYTRIGPAIRHASSLLEARPARKRHLIVITDGKPTDFDRYEGLYGMHDVAWAVREARRVGISVHALGIDPKAARHLPVMFGPGAWRSVRHPSDLPEALLCAYSH